jgi:hypothetical protein
MKMSKLHSNVLQCLTNVGFEELTCYRYSRVFRLTDIEFGEFFQFFSPKVLIFKEGRALAGVIGSMVAPTHAQIERDRKINEDYVITCYSANFPKLRFPPIIGRNANDDIDWCCQISHTVRCFPKSRSELNSLLKAEANICGVKISSMNMF